MQEVLSRNSKLIFVWHDNAGQTMPDSSADLDVAVTAAGFNITVAANANISDPLILLSSASSENQVQNIVHIGKNAKVKIIEYLMSDDNDAKNCSNTTINCAQNSTLWHCILQHAKDATNITQQSVTTIQQDADSQVHSNIFAFGGAKSAVELGLVLQGVNAKCEANYLAYTNARENQNVLLKIDHTVPHCTSKSLARAILKDNSSTDFVGRIVVHPDACKSFADLQIKNILCSNKATANNRPELEIYNDDVHCSHGSSTGHMNEEALFYMRSRGLDILQATEMIIAGFIQPVIESCTIPGIAEFVKGMIRNR